MQNSSKSQEAEDTLKDTFGFICNDGTTILTIIILMGIISLCFILILFCIIRIICYKKCKSQSLAANNNDNVNRDEGGVELSGFNSPRLVSNDSLVPGESIAIGKVYNQYGGRHKLDDGPIFLNNIKTYDNQKFTNKHRRKLYQKAINHDDDSADDGNESMYAIEWNVKTTNGDQSQGAV